MKFGFLDSLLGNPLDRLLTKAAKRNARRVLLYWNRGLGDIALGLYPLVERIRSFLPGAGITVVTRAELAEPFRLLDVQEIKVDDRLVRKGPDGPAQVFARLGIERRAFDLVLDKVNPTKWLTGQLGTVTPKLIWKPEYDRLCEKFPEIDPAALCIGAHVSSETGHLYGYVKDWPKHHWQALFDEIRKRYPVQFVLFGHTRDDDFSSPETVDLRGKASFFETLSVIKNRCQVLVAPDSGVLSMAYYLDCDFPITVISLWADPRQGVLKQGVASPNPALKHYPQLGEEEDVAKVSVERVAGLVTQALDESAHPS